MVLSQMAKPDPKVLFHEATEYLKQHPRRSSGPCAARSGCGSASR